MVTPITCYEFVSHILKLLFSTFTPMNMAVESGSIKLPTFWVLNPDAWFVQAEAQFALRHMPQDKTKYFHVIGQHNLLVDL